MVYPAYPINTVGSPQQFTKPRYYMILGALTTLAACMAQFYVYGDVKFVQPQTIFLSSVGMGISLVILLFIYHRLTRR